jgi:hypothetical protein
MSLNRRLVIFIRVFNENIIHFICRGDQQSCYTRESTIPDTKAGQNVAPLVLNLNLILTLVRILRKATTRKESGGEAV